MRGRRHEAAERAARVYERLLAIYPAKHRREYGPLMAQLFRDQCRDALEREGWMGLVGLWCRVLWDTAKMSVVEHIAAIQRIDFMKITSRLTSSNWLAAVAVGMAGDRRWAARYSRAELLTSEEAYLLLKRVVAIRQFRNTSLLEVRVFSEDRDEAAAIANKVVDVYRSATSSPPLRARVEITDRAEPGLRPVRPNVPLNVTVGLIAGLTAGFLAGGLVMLIRQKQRGDVAPSVGHASSS